MSIEPKSESKQLFYGIVVRYAVVFILFSAVVYLTLFFAGK